MADPERTFWERILEAPYGLFGSAARAANNRECGICEGLLQLDNPNIVKTPSTLRGHDTDCLSLVWAEALDFTIVGGGGGGGGPGATVTLERTDIFLSNDSVTLATLND